MRLIKLCTFVLAAYVVQADVTRSCSLTVCETATLDDPIVNLSCKAAHANVVKISTSASLNSTCYDASTNTEIYGDLEGNVVPCKSAKSALQAKCRGEGACSVDLSDALAVCNEEVIEIAISCEQVLDTFAILSWILVVCVSMSMGATVRFAAVREVFGQHKRSIVVGLLAQFIIMPLLAFVISKIFGFSDLVAVGAVIVGSSPCGITSNLLSYITKGNWPVSIVLAVLSSCFAVVWMPFNVYLYGNLGLGLNEGVRAIPFARIVCTMLVVVISMLVGMIVLYFSKPAAKYTARIGSVLGLAFLGGAFGSVVNENREIFDYTSFPMLWAATAIYLPLGLLIGMAVSACSKLHRKEQRTIGIETGVQNFGVAFALIGNTFEGCSRGEALSFPMLAVMWLFVEFVLFYFLLRCFHAPCDGRGRDRYDEDLEGTRRTCDMELNKIKRSGRVEHGFDEEDITLEEQTNGTKLKKTLPTFSSSAHITAA